MRHCSASVPAEQIALARDKIPGIGDLNAVALADCLLDEEISVLRAILGGEADPSLQQLRSDEPAADKGIRLVEMASAAPLPAPAKKSISLEGEVVAQPSLRAENQGVAVLSSRRERQTAPLSLRMALQKLVFGDLPGGNRADKAPDKV